MQTLYVHSWKNRVTEVEMTPHVTMCNSQQTSCTLLKPPVTFTSTACCSYVASRVFSSSSLTIDTQGESDWKHSPCFSCFVYHCYLVHTIQLLGWSFWTHLYSAHRNRIGPRPVWLALTARTRLTPLHAWCSYTLLHYPATKGQNICVTLAHVKTKLKEIYASYGPCDTPVGHRIEAQSWMLLPKKPWVAKPKDHQYIMNAD